MASNAVAERRSDDSILVRKDSSESPNKVDGIDALLSADSARLREPVKTTPQFQMLVYGGRR